MDRPTVSIVIPIHDMQGGADFLWRSVNKLMDQTFQDFEIVITRQGKMAENTNAGIKKARGKYIKILYLDDELAHREVLESMVAVMESEGSEWLIVGTSNNLRPYMTDDIEKGNNKLGSPSALMLRNRHDNLMFDESMSWLLDCDYYKRMYEQHGEPTILGGCYINIGEGPHQMTHILTDEEKEAELDYINTKHA